MSGEQREAFPTYARLKEWYAGNDDVAVLRFPHPDGCSAPEAEARTDDGPPQLLLLYCSSMADVRLQNRVLPQARAGLPQRLQAAAGDGQEEMPDGWRPLQHVEDPGKPGSSWQTRLNSVLFQAEAVLLDPVSRRAWSALAGSVPGRTPSEAATEVSVRGPKDGFVEQIDVNTSLIRFRLRCPALKCEHLWIGDRSRSKVALLYESSIANPDLVDSIRRKLQELKVDDVASARQLQDLLVGKSWTLVPLTTYTGRPDFAVQCLMNGRVIIMLEGNPTAIVAPANLFLLMKAAEDLQSNYMYVNFTRLLRYLCLFISAFLPGLYVALALFHVDQIPFSLLATILNARRGLPLNVEQEMILALLLIEIFREAGVRLPGAIGQTLTVVGGLIIGDAAVRSGLVSPVMIVIAAMTFVAGSTLVNQSLSGAVTLIRFYCYFCSFMLGIFGFMLAVISVAVYLARLESFGVPFLAPLSPMRPKDLLNGLFIVPFRRKPERPGYLDVQDPLK
ncbi:spore germination protein [Paenibacillus humicus]|uniref:spore germination protein n=1 Tax=Paenibacillus humicus TaxID=412861 RepID=UPI000FDAAB92|nr:spore germination protein [Paenibacillus humicus]